LTDSFSGRKILFVSCNMVIYLNVSELARQPRLVHRGPCLLGGVDPQSPMLLLKVVNAALVAAIGLPSLWPLFDQMLRTKDVYLLCFHIPWTDVS